MAEDGATGGELNAAIARAVVGIHRRYAGRGPTKAQAFYHENILVVVLEDVMTAAERTVAAGGRHTSVTPFRQELLETMRTDLTAAVEARTSRKVTALMTDTHVESNMATEIFVLDRAIHAPSADGGG